MSLPPRSHHITNPVGQATGKGNRKVNLSRGGRPPGLQEIAVIEKGSELGSHSLSGAVMDPIALSELIPDFQKKGAPLEASVSGDEILYLTETGKFALPFTPPPMRNHGNWLVSLNKLVKWLGGMVEERGINLFCGFSGREVIYEGERVAGVITGDKGIDKNGQPKGNHEPGIEIRAKVTVFGEGPYGSLAQDLIKKLKLCEGKNPQSYATGVKEIWEIPPGRIKKGHVIHTMGYPLGNDTFGGGFIYAFSETLLSLGLVVALDYKDPYGDPHGEFQRFKQHPVVASLLKEGKMVRYGAKTIPEGGYFAIPRLFFDGGLLVGDSAGFVNVPRLKGIHYAIKSGILAAETVLDSLVKGDSSAASLSPYAGKVEESFIGKDLHKMRFFKNSFSSGFLSGFFKVGLQYAMGGWWPGGMPRAEADHQAMRSLAAYYRNGARKPQEKKYDGTLTFNKVSDVYLSGTKHEENQPCHLVVLDRDLCVNRCTREYGNPCRHFCPAQVYEWMKEEEKGAGKLVIQPSNCVHCKTCEIKDPYGNILWVTPEGGGGPEYTGM
ncbi:MAG: electron transfer flavoprotein-ubiquinone oxidoreductase [Armatimonadetes bacterium]|nr:electron transfer flavoprotein-ubiquinone oxidoreductase [Armatimonadota bacterium]